MLLKSFIKRLRGKKRPVGHYGKDPHIALRKGRRNFVFIHINKTAGSSICQHVGIPAVRHYTVKQAIEEIGTKHWQEVYSFTVIRNPWAKVLSQYHYRVKMNKNNLGNKHLSFDQWVEKVYGIHPDPVYRDEVHVFDTQASWLRDDEGKINVSQIIRYEYLNEEFSAVAEIIGVSPILPRINTTIAVDYRTHYSEHSKEIIRQYFKEDLEIWKWEF